jgi:hypothetical protein
MGFSVKRVLVILRETGPPEEEVRTSGGIKRCQWRMIEEVLMIRFRIVNGKRGSETELVNLVQIRLDFSSGHSSRSKLIEGFILSEVRMKSSMIF